MTKRYAPDVPDARWHRPGDTAYLRELLAAAGLSQRAAGPRIGMSERAMRYRVSGEQPLSYSEQYCLEVLADRAQSGDATMQTQAPTERAQPLGNVWHNATERPITRADAGKLIVGKDKFGNPISGAVLADEFGVSIREPTSLDSRHISADRIAQYTLLDPPEEL